MSMRAVLALCILFLFAPGGSAEEAQPGPKPGFADRVGKLFHWGKGGQEKREAVRTRDFLLDMELSPEPLRLSENRQIQVKLLLTNRSRKAVQLVFPTTQRIEVVIRDQSGKQLAQWSEDQSFEKEQTFLTINPRERVEYDAMVATRDLSPGKGYLVEVFFPGYNDLKIQRAILPQK